MTTTRSDPVLGRIVLDEKHNWYEGTQKTNDGESLRFFVKLNDSEDEETTLAEARALLPTLLCSFATGREFACNQLLALKNDGWLEDGESPLSREQFIAALRIDSLVICAGRECEFWFEDGDMFWGHAILLQWSFEKGFYRGDIEG